MLIDSINPSSEIQRRLKRNEREGKKREREREEEQEEEQEEEEITGEESEGRSGREP